MNKKIIISLGIIGLAAALAIGATTAFFSDTETSTGNLFAAGSIDLKIDNESRYNGEPSTETSWELKDLAGELFFNFTDLKPGDWGEDTVSLHVYDNDAWACVTFDNMLDRDHGCTEPERKAEREAYGAGNATCDGHPDGELSENLYFVFWADVCKRLGANYPVVIPPALPGDNVFQPECDYLLMEGWANEILPGTTYTLAAPGEYNVFTRELDQPLTGSEDYYIGKAWCFGKITEILPDGTVVCDGGSVSNITQTDSLEADITFYAEQSRNNPNFSCIPVCEYSVVPTGQSYDNPVWGTVTYVTITNTDCTIEDAIKVEHSMNYQQGQAEGQPAGWAGISCIEPGYSQVLGGGVWDGAVYAQGPAEFGAPAIDGNNYPVYPHWTFTGGEEGWVVEAAGAVPPTGIYALCGQ